MVRLEAGVGHAKRFEDLLPAEALDGASVDCLDDLAQPVDPDPVGPTRAGIAHEGIEQSLSAAGQYRGQPCHLHVLGHVGVPDFVLQTARMGRQMPDGDRASGVTQDRDSSVEAVEDLHATEVRYDVRNRCVEIELTAIYQDHRGQRSDRLGHGKDTEDAILSGGLSCGSISRAARPLQAVAIANHGDDERYGSLRHRIAQKRVQSRHSTLPEPFLFRRPSFSGRSRIVSGEEATAVDSPVRSYVCSKLSESRRPCASTASPGWPQGGLT